MLITMVTCQSLWQPVDCHSNMLCCFIQLGILLNNLHEMSQVFDHWPKIIPPLSEEETKEKINAKLIQEIEQVMASFHRNVALEISKIIKRIVEKVVT